MNADKKAAELTCPQCHKPAQKESFPFCSARCRAVDLNNWLSGSYRIPGEAISNETNYDEDED